MDRKAQGMSMNIIVVAAIALIILVVLIIIFVGRTGKFASGVDACQGKCVSVGDCAKEDYSRVDPKGKCYDIVSGEERTDQECCIAISAT